MTETQLLQTLAPHQISGSYAPGAVLFHEGAQPWGVHILLSGKVDLHFAGRNADLPLQLEGNGTILGLSAMMGGRAHEYTATAATTVTTGFLDTATFFRVLNETPSLWLTVLQVLSRDIQSCYDRVRELAVPPQRRAEMRTSA